MRQRKDEQSNGEKPDWLLESLRACLPPDAMTVTEFADSHELIDRKKPFNSALTPYLTEIQDAFTDPDVEEIWFCKPTQVGGTRVILNMLAYIIAQDPDDTMVVYPTLELATSTSKNRIQPMLLASPVLRELFDERASTDLELHFRNGMVLFLAGANSAASLASRPIRYLFFDEIDKYPSFVGVEANPIKLAIERTKTFAHNRKIVGTSTPTLRTGSIWKHIESAHQLLEYHSACPHCGEHQVMRMRTGDGRKLLRWPEGSDDADAADTAWYECEHCRERITDAMKPTMVRAGKWLATKQRKSSRRILGFRMNTFPSPWVRLGRIASEFIATKNDPEEFQNFVNSWLAEPWEQTLARTSSDLVMERQTEYPEGIVPPGTLLLTGGVDYQPIQGMWIWTIRAWGASLTSWNVAHGIVHSWSDVEAVMNRPYRCASGGDMLVNLACIDSGAEADEVYEFCALNREWAVPVKGSSRPMTRRYSISFLDRAGDKANGMRLVMVDGSQYKSMIAGRMNRPNGPGSWMVHAECDRDYAEQVTSEHKVTKRDKGREVEVWEMKLSHAANHYLDAEVYAAVAADLLDVRYLSGSASTDQASPAIETPAAGQDKPWLETREDWL